MPRPGANSAICPYRIFNALEKWYNENADSLSQVVNIRIFRLHAEDFQ